MNDVKPGFKSSEFWMAAAASVVGILIASGAFADTSSVGRILGLVAAALASMGYSWSRGKVKSASK
ncbi:MAG TPA: hypothetical protein ENJ16_04665 [Planctomycetaceae bacterium]|nr:hypothetical protein [Planctomycetaceae bacterium]